MQHNVMEDSPFEAIPPHPYTHKWMRVTVVTNGYTDSQLNVDNYLSALDLVLAFPF